MHMIAASCMIGALASWMFFGANGIVLFVILVLIITAIAVLVGVFGALAVILGFMVLGWLTEPCRNRDDLDRRARERDLETGEGRKKRIVSEERCAGVSLMLADLSRSRETSLGMLFDLLPLCRKVDEEYAATHVFGNMTHETLEAKLKKIIDVRRPKSGMRR